MPAAKPRRRGLARAAFALCLAYIAFTGYPAVKSPPRPPSRARTARETLTSIDAPLDARSTSSARVDAPESPSEAEPSSVATARVGPRARTTRRARAETLKLSGFQPREGFEAGGDVVKWGDKFLKDSAEACHDACVEMRDEGCTVFVWCGFESGCLGQPHKSCWLKKQARATMTTGTEGGGNPWTSGSIYVQDDMRGDPDPSRKFHVVMTTNNAVYQGWQARVMYYHFQKQKAAQGPNGQMGGFTRVLHDVADGLEDEIPTCIVDRLEDELGFVVLSRPFAFVQFFEKCPQIEEDFILMAEPDHLYIKPVPNLMRGDTPAAFPFFYINPKEKPDIVRRFLPGITDEEMKDIDGIGSSPVFIRKDDLERLAPAWAEMSVALQKDKDAKAAWGWVIEMYGYTLAAYKLGISHDLRPQMAAQPPWDKAVGDFISIHFTYGMDYDLDGVFTPGKMGAWRFDKRSYSHAYPPKKIPDPPKGMNNDLVRALVDAVNEASAALPDWGKWGTENVIAGFN
jgi:hypothetical protein